MDSVDGRAVFFGPVKKLARRLARFYDCAQKDYFSHFCLENNVSEK
jgi:hypothetical protein